MILWEVNIMKSQQQQKGNENPDGVLIGKNFLDRYTF